MSRIRRVAQEPFKNRAPMMSVLLAQAGHDSWYFGLVAPHVLAPGIFAQPTTVVYGFGRSFVGPVCEPPVVDDAAA